MRWLQGSSVCSEEITNKKSKSRRNALGLYSYGIKYSFAAPDVILDTISWTMLEYDSTVIPVTMENSIREASLSYFPRKTAAAPTFARPNFKSWELVSVELR